MFDTNFLLLLIGGLLLVSVFLSKFTSKIGVPALIVFLFIGIFLDASQFLAPTVENYQIVQSISIFALIVIMFSGGLDTDMGHVKPIFKDGIALSTVGVVITAFVIGFLIHYLLGLDLMLSLLLGSVVSSTDAAAVFSIFKTQDLHIKNNLDNVLELESATNDPMAYILVTSFIYLILHPDTSLATIAFDFVRSLALGAILGVVLGKVFAKILSKIKLSIEGLYPVLLLACAILSFAVAEAVHGNGFLAVYIAGLLVGNSKIRYKYTQLSFFEGLAWLMQICMFILLGAFTQPSELITILIPAILISLLLIFVARPLAVLISLAPFKMDMNSKAFLSWAGIKGAVPIVFAFYPLVAGVQGAELIFDMVLVITCISVLLQGSTLKFMAKHFGLVEE